MSPGHSTLSASAQHRGAAAIRAADLALPVQALIDPHGRQFVATRLVELTGTRVNAFVLTRQEAPGKWGGATYASDSIGLIGRQMTSMIPAARRSSLA